MNGVAFHNYYRGVHWGNAANWDDAARAAGIRVDATPARGAVAHWNARNHVAYVERVNSDGSIVLSDMNSDLHNRIRSGFTVRPGDGWWPERFIHIKDLSPASASYKGMIVRNRNTGPRTS
ncbi:MAG: CHAP domain-containing protein [bacterium]|nr:CHAP domain-containing protein [bacterium]